MAVVEVENAGGLSIITLNRPRAMNALSRDLRAALAKAIDAAAADETVRVVILTGAGERAFCAGLDLKEIGVRGLGGGTDGQGADDPVAAIGRCAKPVIGAINGVAITGGFELALACDILIASSAAAFADTHVRVGVIPGWGLSQRLARRIGISRAKELSLSGNFLDAAAALAWGLVNRVVAPGELMAAATALGRDIADCDPGMVGRYKRLIDDGYALPFGAAMALEAERSHADNAAVTAAAVEIRRAAILARGRAQHARPG